MMVWYGAVSTRNLSWSALRGTKFGARSCNAVFQEMVNIKDSNNINAITQKKIIITTYTKKYNIKNPFKFGPLSVFTIICAPRVRLLLANVATGAPHHVKC